MPSWRAPFSERVASWCMWNEQQIQVWLLLSWIWRESVPQPLLEYLVLGHILSRCKRGREEDRWPCHRYRSWNNLLVRRNLHLCSLRSRQKKVDLIMCWRCPILVNDLEYVLISPYFTCIEYHFHRISSIERQPQGYTKLLNPSCDKNGRVEIIPNDQGNRITPSYLFPHQVG